MLRNPFSVLGAFALVLVLFSAPTSAATNAKAFVKEMGDKAFSSLSEEGISDEERITRFKNLLSEAFDLPRIARFTLGRYWRTASEGQKTEFIALFEKFVIQSYANRFQDLSGQKFVIVQSREVSSSQSLVLSKIQIPGKPSVKVNWRVRMKDAKHKVIDVIVEGISMSVTQRDEFVSVIRQTGGKVGGLINALRKKTSSN